MFCIKCGAKNDDDAKFCEKCGANLLEEDTQNNIAEEQKVGTENSQVVEEVAPVTEAFNSAPEYALAPAKSKKPIIIAIVAVLILGILFWDSVLATLSPKLYTQVVLMDTIDEVSDELMKSEKNILGFNIANKKNLTYSVEAILNEVDGRDMNDSGFRFTIKDSASKKKLMLSADAITNGEPIVSGYFMLNNKSMYLDCPELFDQSLSIPSKKFGKAWQKSELAELLEDESGIKISEDTDLSYSNLFKEKEVLTKKSEKAIKKEIKKLIKASEVEKDKGTAKVDGKTVNTKTYIVSIDPDDMEDTLENVLGIIEEDKNINKIFEDNKELEAVKDQVFNSLGMAIGAGCDVIEGDIILELQVYNGKAVVISSEFKCEGMKFGADVAFENKKNLIDDINAELYMVDGEDKGVVEISSKGNHIAKGKVFTDSTVVVVKAEGETLGKFEHEMTLDMKKKVYEQELVVSVDGEEASVELEGTCSNRKEFKLAINKLKVSGPDGVIPIPEFKGEVSLTIAPKAKFEKINTSKTLNLLEASEKDVEKWGEKVGEKAEKFAEKNEDLFRSGFGGLLFNSYGYDDYYYN